VKQMRIPLLLATTLMLAATAARTQTLTARDSSSRDSPVEAKSYVNCSLPELQKSVRQLHGIKPDPDQDQLPVLLAKSEKVAEDLLRQMPNLLSREHVEESSEVEDGKFRSNRLFRSRPRDFDYLNCVS